MHWEQEVRNVVFRTCLPHIYKLTAPTEALDEADDAGLTPAHSHPIHGVKGGKLLQVCPESRQELTSAIHHPSPWLEPQLAESTWA